MEKRISLKGYQGVREKLQLAILNATIDSRVLLCCLRELKKGVQAANRQKSTLQLELYSKDYLTQGIAASLEEMIRQTNTARRAVDEFMQMNRKVD